LAIDGERDGLPQLVALQPRGARIAGERPRLEVEPQAVRVETDTEIDELDPPGVGRALERCVRLRQDLAVRHVDLPRFEPQQLRALVWNDLDGQSIEVGQR